MSETGQPPTSPAPENDSAARERPDERLKAMLAELWLRNRGAVLDRVAILRGALARAAEGRLDETSRLRAVDAAHKLAGVLGTFGLPRGTEFAREAEEAFGGARAGGIDCARLDRIVSELAEMVRSKS